MQTPRGGEHPVQLGAVDLRPRPIVAPLVFTVLGSVGALALFLGQRARMPRR